MNDIIKNHICEYGCGNEAKFQLKSGKWCCTPMYIQCPEIKRKISEGLKLSHQKNLKWFKNKNYQAWNKGLTKETDNRIKKICETKNKKIKLGLLKQKVYTNEERKILSLKAIKNIQNNNNNKILTVPEKLFINLLKELNYGIKIPEFIEKNYNIKSDNIYEIYFQYPINCYLCDFVYLKKKIIFRIQGDYWHANPNIYINKEKFTKAQINNLNHDKNAKNYFELHGWKVLDIWESDLKYRYNETKNIINDFLNSNITIFEFKEDENWNNFLKNKFLIKKKKERKKYFCKECHTLLLKKTKLCEKCFNKRRKINNINKETLENELNNNNITMVSKKYNVSHTTIKRWIIKFNINYEKIKEEKKNKIKENYKKNKNKIIIITYNNKTQTLKQWSNELKIPINTIRYRFNVGKPIEEVLKIKN